MNKTILIVDDHANTRTLIADYLGAVGYQVVAARDGVEGLGVARTTRPDLILLDVMMPQLDGFDFIRVYRREHRTPIILLTARLAEVDKVLGLELGADDYVTKPFSLQELVARIRAVLRRAGDEAALEADQVYRVADLEVDLRTRRVTVGARSITLTPSEFDLLATLVAAPGRVFSREQLRERLQGPDYEGVERTMDVHIRNLRRKIEPDPANPRYIKTVFGIGYRCCTAAEC